MKSKASRKGGGTFLVEIIYVVLSLAGENIRGGREMMSRLFFGVSKHTSSGCVCSGS